MPVTVVWRRVRSTRCRIRFVEEWLWITLLREKIATEIGWINLSKQRLYKHVIKTKSFPLHSRNPLSTKSQSAPPIKTTIQRC